MKTVAFLIALTFALPALAQERYDFYKGIRQMGMGGASAATVNDETSLLANPAALGKLRDYFITVVDPEVEVSTGTQQVIGYAATTGLDPQKTLDKCKLKPDVHMHERGQVFPSIVVPNFGVGIYARYQVDAQVNSATNLFDYNYDHDYAGVFGFNFRFWDGIIKIGTNARIVNRTEVHDSAIATTSTTLKLATMASSGIGVASDAGLIIALPVAYLPTLAGVYRDIGNTSYALRSGLTTSTTTRPNHTPATVDVAMSISPILGRRVRSVWTLEYQDIKTYSKETDQMRRAHAGVEFNIADALFIRGGLNQRYWTGGLELSMGNYQFQVASYGEDIGVVGTPKEDRRYAVKFAFRF